MEDSDDDYVAHSSGDDDPLYREDGISKRTRNRGEKPDASGGRKSKVDSKLKGTSGGYSWEDEYHRSWDVVREDAGGSLAGAVAGLVEESKKRRMKDTTPLQRGIIRNLILVLDFSSAMMEKDLRPNRYQLMLNYSVEFVTEFFDQNPISQLGIVGMRDGLAMLVSELDGNPHQHIVALQALRKQEPKGVPSLQNALEMARGLLYHVPAHCTKEILIIFGALLSSDPGDIHKTINSLVEDKIHSRVIGLAAQVAVCKELSLRTNHGELNAYGVVLNEAHFKDLLMDSTTPLAITKIGTTNTSMLVEMGFPSRISETEPSLCACHSKLTQGEYLCPRCQAKICSLPMLCPCCNLTLILSTHLARSYHHLFPLRSFREVKPSRPLAEFCFSCQQPFPKVHGDGPTSRYACPKCNQQFCIDCDLFCHETLHNCPGCESLAINPLQNERLKLKIKKPVSENESVKPLTEIPVPVPVDNGSVN
jgi:transcription initiation factor TFIIH subunit 2